MHIDQYRDAVAQLAGSKANSRFSNKGNDHAAIVVENLFKTAENTVRLFSGQLAKDFFLRDEIRNQIANFLAPDDRRLLVLTEKEPDAETVAFLNTFPSKISLRCLSADLKASMPNHFLVADGRAYRLEVNDDKREAVVNFNEPTVAAALTAMFDRAAAVPDSQLS